MRCGSNGVTNSTSALYIAKRRYHAVQEGTWNKVGMLRKIMEDVPPERAEWIVYMQPETFFDDTTFAIPFDSYRDRDLVLIGNQTALRNGQMRGEAITWLQ